MPRQTFARLRRDGGESITSTGATTSAATTPVRLRPAARAQLVRSLQQFQLGDGGGPACLIAWIHRRLLDADSEFKELFDLWFNEEKEQPRWLGSALKRFGAPEITSRWSFGLFYGMRGITGARFELLALLLAEIVSHVGCKMPRKHIDDDAMKDLGALIVRDEAGRIAFQRARRAAAGGRHDKLRELMFRLRGLATGTVL